MNNTSKTKNQPNGRAFKVTITETYQRTITVYESEMKEPTVQEAERVGGGLVAGQPNRTGNRRFQGVEVTACELPPM